MKVRTNSRYIYYPNLLDRVDARTDLVPGTIVRVIHPYGCPKPNTMNHAHVADAATGEFIGLVHCNSLHSLSDAPLVIDLLKKEANKNG